MVELVLNAEQAELVARSYGSVKIVDVGGNRLGMIARPFSMQRSTEGKPRPGLKRDREATDLWQRLAAIRVE
jgi:hypothetical protein